LAQPDQLVGERVPAVFQVTLLGTLCHAFWLL
jgi:hypothetical protein